jgi:hypothetical protein
MGLRSWGLTRRRRPEERHREDVQNRIQLELRRSAYGSEVPGSVSATVLAQRLGLSLSDLQPILDDLTARRLISPGFMSSTYRMRDWSLDDPRGPKGTWR